MKLNKYVKLRDYGGSSYFHVRIKSHVRGEVIESQRYLFFDASTKDAALKSANAKAEHLAHRHAQLRVARDSRVSVASLFFNPSGVPKWFGCRKVVRHANPSYELTCQYSVEGKGQVKKSKSVSALDPESLVFDASFNFLFDWLCGQSGISINPHVLLFKEIIRKYLLERHRNNL